MSTQAPLPDVSSPSIALTTPTSEEQQAVWSATHPSWGPGLTREQYIDREAYLLTVPLSRDGGLSPWILTDSSSSSSERPVLSSCETLKKRAIVSSSAGVIRDVTAHGVASVFTYPDRRGRGYAGKMMGLLGEHLAKLEAAKEGSATMSILFSDIGEKFYAKDGWMPIGNTHIELTVGRETSTSASPGITELSDPDLAALAERDEQLLRSKLSQPLPPNAGSDKPPKTTRVAILPDHDTLQWHYRREDFMMRHFLSQPVRVRGAMYKPPSSQAGGRVWALWVRTRYGGADGHAVFTVLHFLRFVIEDEEATSDEQLAEALRGILGVAQREAQHAQCRSIDIWSPGDRVRAVFDGRLADLQGRFVSRDMYNVASLRWFGADAEDMEWVANEKFEWC